MVFNLRYNLQNMRRYNGVVFFRHNKCIGGVFLALGVSPGTVTALTALDTSVAAPDANYTWALEGDHEVE